MQFGVSKLGGLLDGVEVSTIFLDQIKDRYFEATNLNKIWNKVVCGKASDDTLNACGLLRVIGCVYVSFW